MDLDQVKSYNEDVAKLREQRDADYAEYEKAGRIWGLVPRERITKIKFPRVKKEIIDRYYALEDMIHNRFGYSGWIWNRRSYPNFLFKTGHPGFQDCGTGCYDSKYSGS